MPNDEPMLNEASRLMQCQKRIRDLVAEHTWLADSIRSAFNDYERLYGNYLEASSRRYAHSLGLARELLERGFVRDPDLSGEDPILIVRIRGLCPASLSEKLELARSDELPAALENDSAAAALVALDKLLERKGGLSESEDIALFTCDNKAIESGTHVIANWRIIVAQPADWKVPTNPCSMAYDDLAEFNDEEYRTIAFHRLGGLADHHSSRPIVREPLEDTADPAGSFHRYALWRTRTPFPDEAGAAFEGVPNADELAEIYGQFLESLDAYCSMVAQNGTKYLPQNQFPSGMDSLLRTAATSERPTKRIYRFKYCGTWYYAVDQARRLWPNHFKD